MKVAITHALFVRIHGFRGVYCIYLLALCITRIKEHTLHIGTYLSTITKPEVLE